jgi:hypothetical protein
MGMNELIFLYKFVTMRTNLALFLMSWPIIFLFSCTDDDDMVAVLTCDTTTSEFQDLYASLLANGYLDRVFYDTEIHEYTFQLDVDAEVCAFGYESQHDSPNTPYTLEIENIDSGQVIYSEELVFSDQVTSYVAPGMTVNLMANTSYALRRIQLDWNGNIGNTIGRLATSDSISFPLTSGNLTILESNFYQNGGPVPNGGVPFIDLILE